MAETKRSAPRTDGYADFIARKLACAPPSGIDNPPALHSSLFEFQRDLTTWALRRGRAALFCDTGLGKTRMQLEWARVIHEQTRKPILVLCPLAVAAQTRAEGMTLGLDVRVCRDGADVHDGVNATNYDRLHRFDPERFGGVVLDESSIIKHHDAKTLRILLDAFARTPFKLACTATPAPNDWTELGTHAEFLGVCSRSEMLSEFFVHDGGETQKWRLKGHARAPFWKWVASWAALVRRPSDLGYDDDRYNLPRLTVNQHTLESDAATTARMGLLFELEAQDLMARRRARNASLDSRVTACAKMINADASEPWIVWCDLNAESDALVKAINGASEVRGAMHSDEKEAYLYGFASGTVRVLVTKPSIAGFGLNWQHCARVAFVGVTDSWEAYYQAVRRCWRFGQLRPVEVHIFASAAEGAVVSNLRRKETDAAAMADALSQETRGYVRAEVHATTRQTNRYEARQRIIVPSWLTTEEDAT